MSLLKSRVCVCVQPRDSCITSLRFSLPCSVAYLDVSHQTPTATSTPQPVPVTTPTSRSTTGSADPLAVFADASARLNSYLAGAAMVRILACSLSSLHTHTHKHTHTHTHTHISLAPHRSDCGESQPSLELMVCNASPQRPLRSVRPLSGDSFCISSVSVSSRNHLATRGYLMCCS